jgi:hypothetical protein
MTEIVPAESPLSQTSVGVIMPRISQLYGVDIYMYFNDHLPPCRHTFMRSTVVTRH